MIRSDDAESAEAVPENTRLQRVVRGVFALGLGAGVQIVGQALTVPAALYGWSEAEYGEWLTLSALASALLFADLGVQTYVVNRLCAHHSRGDTVSFIGDLHSALRAQIPMVLAILAVLVPFLLVAPLDDWLNLESSLGQPLAPILLLLGGEILVGVPMGVVGGIYRATGRLPRAGVIGAVLRFLAVFGSLAIMASGGSFLLVAATRFGVSLVGALFIIVDLKRLNAWLEVWPSQGSLRSGLAMISPGIVFLVIGLADQLTVQGVVVLLQAVAGGAGVAIFATHRTIASLGRMASGLLTNSAWPELTALEAFGEREDVAAAHRGLAKINTWAVSLVVLASIPAFVVIYPVWTLRELTLDPVVWLCLLGQTGLWAVWNPSSTVLMATNRHRTLARVIVGNGLLIWGLSVPLTLEWGIRGAAVAFLAGDTLLACWLVPRVACKDLELDGFRHAREVLPIAFVGLLPSVAIAAVWLLVPGATDTILIAALSAGLGLVSTMVTWRLLSEEERRLAIAVFSRFSLRRRSIAQEGE